MHQVQLAAQKIPQPMVGSARLVIVALNAWRAFSRFLFPRSIASAFVLRESQTVEILVRESLAIAPELNLTRNRHAPNGQAVFWMSSQRILGHRLKNFEVLSVVAIGKHNAVKVSRHDQLIV
jgi:hypothetical protein